MIETTMMLRFIFIAVCILHYEISESMTSGSNVIAATVTTTPNSVTSVETTISTFTTISNTTTSSRTVTTTTVSILSPSTESTPLNYRYFVIGAGGAVIIFFIIAFFFLCLCIIVRTKRRHKETISKHAADTSADHDRADLPLVDIDTIKINTDTGKCSSTATGEVNVKDFPNHVQQMHQESDRGFEEEFDTLSKEHTSTFDIAKLPQNDIKNRFENIFPYDNSRVVLDMLDDEDCSDYINASYIDGYNRPNAYIAAQGPLRNTISDFWRMIWQYKLRTVIMLTETVEAGREKCEQYWPALLNKEWVVGSDLAVTLNEQKQYAEYRVKVLTLKNLSETETDPLVVIHYHFSAWPDHGVPADKSCLIHFIKRVRKNHPYYNTPPLVVHCSAGVGRSGTFIVLDSMMQQLNENIGTIDIYNFVCCMRKKRPLMVQTEAQYAFIHDAIDEFITCGETAISVTNMRITLGKLSKREDIKSGFEEQYELLGSVSDKAKSRMYSREGAKDYNAQKNRFKDILPYDLSRVYLKSTGARGSDYINANYIDGYKHRRAFIATQGPMESTVNDFWRMLWEHKSRVLVMLCGLTEDGKESCSQYWPTEVDSSAVYGRLKVKLVSEDNFDKFIVRKFQIGEDTPYLIPGVPDGVVITQFHHTQWQSHNTLPTTASVLKLMDNLIKTQMGTGNHAITVLCRDGVSRTGTFICIYSQLERLKAEGVVDVFQSIKASRLQRSLMVTNTEQFAFCHQVLADYLDTFDNYANFKDLQ